VSFSGILDTGLPWPCSDGHLDVVKFLVDKGANIHACDDFALHWASANGQLEVVDYLTE